MDLPESILGSVVYLYSFLFIFVLSSILVSSQGHVSSGREGTLNNVNSNYFKLALYMQISTTCAKVAHIRYPTEC